MWYNCEQMPNQTLRQNLNPLIKLLFISNDWTLAPDVSSQVFNRFITSFQPAWLKTEMLENTLKGFVHAGNCI